MTQVYKFLSVPNHQAISDQLYNYVVNHTEILQQSKIGNVLDVEHTLNNNPLLSTWLLSQGIGIKSIMSFLVLYYDHKNSRNDHYLHADTDYDNIRILWPVSNCKHSKTKFWNIDQSKMYMAPNDTVYRCVDPGPHELLDELELTSPVALNVRIPHSVHPNTASTEPRLSFCMLFHVDVKYNSLNQW
jgi:hypothetical protein